MQSDATIERAQRLLQQGGGSGMPDVVGAECLAHSLKGKVLMTMQVAAYGIVSISCTVLDMHFAFLEPHALTRAQPPLPAGHGVRVKSCFTRSLDLAEARCDMWQLLHAVS